ncbi:MAG: SH3 domain-containing protein, partial [Caldilineaceae bacterium]|nr:SH3 domain-containing protein [Caldilineaceae bacterium]
REGPGTNYAQVGQLSTGALVTVVGQNPDGSWWNVCCVDGRSGWVINDPRYVRLQGTPSDVPLSSVPPAVATAVPSTPTPPPSPAPAAIGSNCSANADNLFNSLWQRHRTMIGCPTSGRRTIQTIAEEVFQGGHMFWRKDTDEVYVIYDRNKNNNANLFEGQWTTNPTWKWDGSAPEGIGLTPPSGLVEPVRGFGWVWRNFLNRETGPLGWALDREYGFDGVAQVQTFEQGFMFKGSDAKVYLLLYDGRFFAQ